MQKVGALLRSSYNATQRSRKPAPAADTRAEALPKRPKPTTQAEAKMTRVCRNCCRRPSISAFTGLRAGPRSLHAATDAA